MKVTLLMCIHKHNFSRRYLIIISLHIYVYSVHYNYYTLAPLIYIKYTNPMFPVGGGNNVMGSTVYILLIIVPLIKVQKFNIPSGMKEYRE